VACDANTPRISEYPLSPLLVEKSVAARLYGVEVRIIDRLIAQGHLDVRTVEATRLGHASVKVTERHYAPWVKERQEQLEADVSRANAGNKTLTGISTSAHFIDVS